MTSNDFSAPSQWNAHVAPELIEEAVRLWSTGMFEDYGEKGERNKMALRVRGQGHADPEPASLWMEAVGDMDGPALSVVLVRYRGARWIPGGTVTCVVGGRAYMLMPMYAFWNWEEQRDGTYETLIISSFSSEETLEAFTALIGQVSPVLVQINGGGDEPLTVEFTVNEVDLQWLRDMLVLYRARGGKW